MFDLGRVCIKLAGRDAGYEAVVVEVIDANYVLVDGNVRRRKVNKAHLMPTSDVVEVSKGAATGEVKEALSKLGFEVTPVTKPKDKKSEKPVSKRAQKAPKKAKK